MGFLERAIRRGVSDAVGKAVGNVVRQAIEPAATNFANKAAGAIDQATQNNNQQAQRSSGLEGAMANLERSMQGYATEAAKNMKVCPGCKKTTTADKKFCPECGTTLPEHTVAQGAVCTSCGKQNPIGTKFCTDCGEKLPAEIQKEQAQAENDAAVMTQWDEKLSQYPKWSCGGKNFNIEDYDGHIMFAADFEGNSYQAQSAVEQYRGILLNNGFRQAGQYPSESHLYKMADGICYHVDTEHCFEGDSDCPCIYFLTGEPTGGFDYVKPEPKKPLGFKDLFNF